ncbi:hypothetical protein GGQ74_000593 [Desulfobaculum xiamenense]|uniref:FlgO domain-containing protein n=1 Tax=Desulfobaculum xiamenense TaxID=995050 RepID=A0A846QLA0_9BACT|nr:FlgO family outer membrane protein [Desulfobaculum xiamenense]NJB66953.1 hypothetical protein [Desulfobaculum xiamenense]
MNRHALITAAVLALAVAPIARADEQPATPGEHMIAAQNEAPALDPGSGVTSKYGGSIHLDGTRHSLRNQGQVHPGVLVHDGDKGYIWLHSDQPMPAPDEHAAAAEELRLKVRELAAQLLAPGTDLGGAVTMPVSFVDQDDFDHSSSFGRFIAEQMFNDLTRQGIGVREYRALPAVATRPQDGEFALTRDMERAVPQLASGLVLAGTYYFDKHSVFVNARLFRPSDQMVVRTASVAFPQTPLTRSMLAKGAALRLRTAEVELKSYDEMKDKTTLGYMLEQEDLH